MIDKINLMIWGRDFTIPIAYECYDSETVTAEQRKAAETFASHPGRIEAAKNKVEQYCKEAVMEDAENQKKDNIFSYIKPERLFVKHDKGSPRTALMCKYRYDPEHGLAVVFNADGSTTIGSQDIII